MYFVYILESQSTGKYYIGCTDNIERRLREHNYDLSKYTKIGSPWLLRHKEAFVTLKEARAREKKIKLWKKRKSIEKLINAAFV